MQYYVENLPQNRDNILNKNKYVSISFLCNLCDQKFGLSCPSILYMSTVHAVGQFVVANHCNFSLKIDLN